MPTLSPSRPEEFILDSCSLFRPKSYAFTSKISPEWTPYPYSCRWSRRAPSVPARHPNSSPISENRLSSALTSYMAWATYLTSRYLLLFIHKVRVIIVLWHVGDIQHIKKSGWQGDRLSTCPYPSLQADAPATLMYDISSSLGYLHSELRLC